MHVIVVGAGPSGFSLSLVLAREGIDVTLVDREKTVVDAPRAAHLMVPGIRMLRRAGVLEDVRQAGFLPKDMSWRKLDGTPVVTIEDVSKSKSPDAMTVLPLGDLGKIMLAHAEKYSNLSVKWSHRVTDVGQDENSAWVIVQKEDGTEEKIAGDFVCGCDGGTSQVRKSLFGARNFPGKTWDFQLVATNVYYPIDKFGFDDMNNIIDNENCYVVARLTNDGLWRVSYQEDVNMTYQEVVDNQAAKFEKILPGHPKPADYKLVSLNPYRMHQRCAERFRVGRICIAADAAHLCNPWGGLGLTGGFADVAGLADCLVGISTSQADHSILEKYDEVRRSIYKTFIDPISTKNFFRVAKLDPDKAVENDPFLAKWVTAKNDPVVREELDKGMSAISYDFTQHYNSKL